MRTRALALVKYFPPSLKDQLNDPIVLLSDEEKKKGILNDKDGDDATTPMEGAINVHKKEPFVYMGSAATAAGPRILLC